MPQTFGGRSSCTNSLTLASTGASMIHLNCGDVVNGRSASFHKRAG